MACVHKIGRAKHVCHVQTKLARNSHYLFLAVIEGMSAPSLLHAVGKIGGLAAVFAAQALWLERAE